MKMKYYCCKYCIGKIIEDILIVNPCLRYIKKKYTMNYTCIKKNRGVEGDFDTKWVKISENDFMNFWNEGKQLNARINLLVKED